MFKLFDEKLDALELKFVGLFFMITLGAVSLVFGIDLITGFLGGIIAMMTRDLYRSNTTKQGGVQ